MTLGLAGLFLALCISIGTRAANAALPDDEYRKMLQIAQLKVNRLNALRQAGSANALSTSMVKAVLGRYYQPGDNWDVIACKQKSNMASMTSEAVRFRYACATFHYEVLEIKPGAEPQVKVRVTQREAFGLRTPDPKVAAVDLLMSDKFAQSQKTYHFTDETLFAASPNGLHTAASSLELYPLDVPDIYTAEQTTPTTLPELPPELQNPARQAGYAAADLSKSLWFEQQDIFGREIQVLWQHGDLWPAYMKTANGTAILVRR